MATDGTLMEMKDIKHRRGEFLGHKIRAVKYLVDSGEFFWLMTLIDLEANKVDHFLLAEDERTAWVFTTGKILNTLAG